MKHTIFYIPGLGEKYDSYRQQALKRWSIFGVKTVLLPMNWYQGGTYDERFMQASDMIADALSNKRRVTLIGESAGASMAINLFAAHPEVANVITIAGVNTSSAPVAQRTLRRGPAFAESKQYIDQSLDDISNQHKKHIHTVSAWSDNVVRPERSHIDGAHNHRIPSIGHLFTIFLCLTILSWYIVSLAKRQ